MNTAVMGIFDGGLESSSGGAYQLLAGLLNAAGNYNVLVKLVGTSVHLRKSNYNDNVALMPVHKCGKYLNKVMQGLAGLPLIGNYIGTSGFGGAAQLCLARWGLNGSLDDVKCWLVPHCFSPVPPLGRVIAICLDLQHYELPQYFSPLVRRMRCAGEASLEQVEKIVCISNFTRNRLIERYPRLEKKATTLYMGTNLEIDRLELERAKEQVSRIFKKPFFLYPAIDWRHKNHQGLLQSAKILGDRLSDEFQIILTGRRRRGDWLKRQIYTAGLSQTVMDLGAVSTAMLVALYQNARALVFPSSYEGFGIPLVEAMSFGVPVIASSCTAIPEITADAAILCEPANLEAFSDAMGKILISDELCKKLSRKSIERSEFFRWDSWWDTFLAIMNNKLSCGVIHSHSPSLDPTKQQVHFERAKVMIDLHKACLVKGHKGLDAVICTGGLWNESQETIKDTFLKDQILNVFAKLLHTKKKGLGNKCEADLLEEIITKQTADLRRKPVILKETLSRNNLENIYYALSHLRLVLGRLPDNIFAVKSEGMLERLARDYDVILRNKFGSPPVNVVLLCPGDRHLHKENVEMIEKRKNSFFPRAASYILFVMFKNERLTTKRLKNASER
jgi:glycosyltransferase involved in cell wall biosynthesis